MRVRGEIPGVGEIDIEGNFATEQTLKDLIVAVEQRNKDDKLNTDEINDDLDDLGDNLDDTNEGLSRYNRVVNKAKDIQEKHSKSIKNGLANTKDFFKGLSRSGSEGEAVGDSIAKIGDASGKAISGLSMVGGPAAKALGTATGAAVKGVTALTGAALGTVDEYRGINRQIQNAGVQIRGGFDAFADAAAAAEIPINEFGEAIISSKNTLRLLSGGAPGGVRAVSDAFRAMSDETESSLRSLGFSTEEIVQGIADFSVDAQRAGRRLTPAELATESESYLKNLRELSRLTGEDVKSLQAKIEADRANLFIENEISKVSSKNQEDVRGFAASLSEMGFGAIRDFALAGKNLTQESGFLVSQFPLFSNVIQDVTQQVKAGALSEAEGVAEIQRIFKNASPELEAELQQVTGAFGDISATGKFDYGQTLGEFALAIRRAQGGFETMADTDASSVVEGSVQDAIGAVETAGKRIQSAIQDTTLKAISNFSDKLVGLADNTGAAASAMADAAEWIVGETVARDLRGNIDTDRELQTALSQLQQGTISGNSRQELVELIRQQRRDDWYQRAGLNENTTGGVGEFITDTDAKAGIGLTAMLRNFTEDQLLFNAGNLTMSDQDILNELQQMNSTLGNAPQQADGGIVDSPESGGVTITHGTEAVVPLPGGRAIPVDLKSSFNRIDTSVYGNNENQNRESADVMKSLLSLVESLGDKMDAANAEAAQEVQISTSQNQKTDRLITVSRNMLEQMTATSERLDRVVRSMDENNYIASKSRFSGV